MGSTSTCAVLFSLSAIFWSKRVGGFSGYKNNMAPLFPLTICFLVHLCMITCTLNTGPEADLSEPHLCDCNDP